MFPAAVTLVFCAGCALSSNVNSGQLQGERVQIEPLEPEARGIIPITTLTALIPRVVSFAAGKLEAFYTRESGKYVASYGTTYVGDDFYRSDGSQEFTYGGFELSRFVQEGGQEVQATSVRLSLSTNRERNLMQLLPTRVQLGKAKAKLRPGDNTLDLSIKILVNAWWQIKSGEIRSRELGDVTLVLTNLSLGDTYTLGGTPNNTYLENQHGQKSNYNIQSSWLAPVPVSVSEQGNTLEHARGNYSITISVTEIDDYGLRVAQFGKDIYDSRALLGEALEGVVD